MQPTSEPARRQLCRVIDVLLEDEPIEARLSAAIDLIEQIENYQGDIPKDILEEFNAVIHWISRTVAAGERSKWRAWTPKEEAQLTDMLFGLYAEISGGWVNILIRVVVE